MHAKESIMDNDIKTQIQNAVSQGLLQPVTLSEEKIKAFCAKQRSSAIKLFLGSIVLILAVALLAFLFISVFHVIVYSIKIILGLLLVLLFPIFAIYNIFSTIGTISKKNYDFYEGEVFGMTEKGYKIRGLESADINFLFPRKDKPNLTPGEKAIVARFKEELSLLEKN